MSTPSDDLAEIAGKVEKIVRDLQAEKEQNRRDFPNTAKVKQILEDANPIKEYLAHPEHTKMTKTRVKVIWAEENGRRIGRERD